MLMRALRAVCIMLSAALVLRAVLLYLPKAGAFAGALEAMTEPLMIPVRALLRALSLEASLPVDVSAVTALAFMLALARICERLAV